MREILFKGFAPDEDGKQIITLNGKDYRGDWVEGYYIKHLPYTPAPLVHDVDKARTQIEKDYQHVIMRDGFSDWNMPRNTEHFQVIPETVCEFTGLTDKNGKRIWEGDNIRVFGGESDDEFCEYDNTFVLEMPNPDHLGQIRDAENVEVIGDIFNTRSVG